MRHFIVEYVDADHKSRYVAVSLSQCYIDETDWDNRPLYFQKAALGIKIVNAYHIKIDHIVGFKEAVESPV